MTFTPDHLLAQTTIRQDQLRREADAYRRGRTARLVPRTRNRRTRRTTAAIADRIRRSVYSLTEWPHPV